MSERPPNILLVMTDQQRADALGAAGAAWVPTPNLDRLAAEGTRFANCTVNNPICTPSRASIFSGRELPGHGVYRLHDILPDDVELFPEALRRDAGYRTALFGKLHVSGRAEEERRRHPQDGFETYEWSIEGCVAMDSRFNGYVPWLRERDPDFLADLSARKRGVKHHPEEVHFTRWTAERTEAFIRARATSRDMSPFFCAMSLFDPHNPYDDYPPAMAARIDRNAIPAPIARDDLPEAARRERAGSYLGTGLSPDDIAEMRFGYAASIAFADQEIGRVLRALDETGQAEDTLVIFMSDHGDALGDHGMMVKGVALYEPVVKVPLIVRWPGRVPAGQVSTALAQGHDVAATCRAAAGLGEDAAPWCTGRDLIALARGEGRPRRTAFSVYRNSGINSENAYWDPLLNATAAIREDAKLIAYASGADTEFELFDLAADPQETVNLWSDPSAAPLAASLLADMAAWLQREGAGAGSRGGSAVPASDDFMQNALRPA